ncbi:hypothetical protein GJ496_006762 [Pomphorhynchus laevis]|nr:hypothetical protein GJ496_006762 [Pomphorhynchus laevis]
MKQRFSSWTRIGLNGITKQPDAISATDFMHQIECLAKNCDAISAIKLVQEALSDDERLKQVLDRLNQANIRVNKDKCVFDKFRVPFLGHILDEDNVVADPEKIREIQEIPSPKNKGQVRAFLGTRLYKLTSKKVKWEWTGEHHNEWIQVKELLLSTKILKTVDEKSPLKLMCDACEIGMGAVLMQKKGK